MLTVKKHIITVSNISIILFDWDPAHTITRVELTTHETKSIVDNSGLH